jgi:thioredoxin reductase
MSGLHPYAMTSNQVWDAIVVGGGSAGLSGALTLVRARRRVLVLDTGQPRNRFTHHMHAVLGRDGTSPAVLLADGRREVEQYGGVIRSCVVHSISGPAGDFQISTDSGVETARRVLVATGGRDKLPDVEGLERFWGRGVAMCPYCDAYEVRDQPIGILATGPGSVFQAQLLRQWSEKIVYLTNGLDAPSDEDRKNFEARGIDVVEGVIAQVSACTDGTLSGVDMVDDRHISLAAIFTAPQLVPADHFLQELQPAKAPMPGGEFLQLDSTGQTSIPGIWAAGNVANPYANVPMSIGAAAAAAGAINHSLVLDDIAAARQTQDVRV